MRRLLIKTATKSARTRVACLWSASHGPACSAGSTATASGSSTPTGRQSRSKASPCTPRATVRRRDDDGYFWIMGRIDDVINVSGPSGLAPWKLRARTCRVTSAVVEAAVVGMPHEIKGTGIAVILLHLSRITHRLIQRLSDDLAESRAHASTWRMRSARSPSPT